MSPFRLLSSLLACSLITLAFTGCGKSSDSAASPSGEKKIKLGFLVKQPEEPWFQYEWKGGDKAAAQYGFDLIKIGVPDGEKTLTAIDSLAANGAQGFVICTPDVRLGPAIVAKAKANNLKVVTVDDRFVNADGQFITSFIITRCRCICLEKLHVKHPGKHRHSSQDQDEKNPGERKLFFFFLFHLFLFQFHAYRRFCLLFCFRVNLFFHHLQVIADGSYFF